MLFAFLFGFALLPFLLPFCAAPYSIFLHYKIYIVRVWVLASDVCEFVCGALALACYSGTISQTLRRPMPPLSPAQPIVLLQVFGFCVKFSF